MGQIAREIGCARSSVMKHLDLFGISIRQGPLRTGFTGQLAFGYKLERGKVVPHRSEQKLILEMRRLRTNGNTYREIADWLTSQNIRTKTGLEKWDRKVVHSILKRSRREGANGKPELFFGGFGCQALKLTSRLIT
ncbi:MAG: hypothetical protein EA369_01445 [Bradymonadales bacterium]|nr:MAG: hypothetical protein EA369_01445 [Bradymonadales bacterium]